MVRSEVSRPVPYVTHKYYIQIQVPGGELKCNFRFLCYFIYGVIPNSRHWRMADRFFPRGKAISLKSLILKFCHILAYSATNWDHRRSLVVRASGGGAGGRGSIPDPVTPKT